METTATSPDAARVIEMSRLFDAPRELVWRMWTQPEHVAWWWGPRGFSTTIHEMDVRPGGAWRFIMRGPDGTDYPNDVVYLEVDRPSRLSYRHKAPPFDMHVIFVAQGEKTLVTARMTFETAELRDRLAREVGAVEGLEQTLARLSPVLAAHAALEPATPAIVLTRVFDAPRERVFAAHVDPQQLRQWWGPYGNEIERCETDPRPGGAWRVDERSRDGALHRFGGVYKEIVAPERIAHTFEWGGKPGESLDVVVTFEDLGNGTTRLTSITRLPSLRARDEMLAHGAIGGAVQSHERLSALLGEKLFGA